MKEKQISRCPCCSRHCPMDKLKCKRGRAYFAKQEKQRITPEKQRKWDRYTREGGLARRLLWAARCTKKALRKQKRTEDEIFAALSPDEQLVLEGLLARISESSLAKKKKDV